MQNQTELHEVCSASVRGGDAWTPRLRCVWQRRFRLGAQRCSDCAEARITPRSWGHRSCPLCQNHTTTQWFERQRDKLLPVGYFMVTFTLPAELRPLARAEPHAVYSALFRAASQTIEGFGTRKLKVELGQCAVLHTHNRRLDIHPHTRLRLLARQSQAAA